MEKVFVLCRMWDKKPRGHETVERISDNIEPILEYIKQFSYVGGKTQKVEMDESFNMHAKKNRRRIHKAIFQ